MTYISINISTYNYDLYTTHSPAFWCEDIDSVLASFCLSISFPFPECLCVIYSWILKSLKRFKQKILACMLITLGSFVEQSCAQSVLKSQQKFLESKLKDGQQLQIIWQYIKRQHNHRNLWHHRKLHVIRNLWNQQKDIDVITKTFDIILDIYMHHWNLWWQHRDIDVITKTFDIITVYMSTENGDIIRQKLLFITMNPLTYHRNLSCHLRRHLYLCLNFFTMSEDFWLDDITETWCHMTESFAIMSEAYVGFQKLFILSCKPFMEIVHVTTRKYCHHQKQEHFKVNMWSRLNQELQTVWLMDGQTMEKRSLWVCLLVTPK